MNKKDLAKIEKSIREALVELDQSAIGIKPEQRKALNRMADNVKEIGGILASIRDSVPKIADKLLNLADATIEHKAEQEKTELTNEGRKIFDDQIEFARKHAENNESHAYFRNIHQADYERLLRQREAHLEFLRKGVEMRAILAKADNRMGAFAGMAYALQALQVMREVESQDWLEEVHLNMIKEQTRATVAEFKKRSKGTFPQKIEDAVIGILNMPVDLLGSLTKMLELRRKLARLNLETDADLKAVLALSDKTEDAVASAKEVDKNLKKLLIRL